MAFPVHSVVTRRVDSADGFGTARFEPVAEIIAGSYGTWRVTYEAGAQGIAVGGGIRIRTDADTDWGIPQFRDPTADDFMTITTPEGVQASVRVDGPKSLVVQVLGRNLKPGEQITLTLGDTIGGSPGSRAQTFLETRHNFLIEVQPERDGAAVLLADSPHVMIVGGPAERLVVVAPWTRSRDRNLCSSSSLTRPPAPGSTPTGSVSNRPIWKWPGAVRSLSIPFSRSESDGE